MFSAAAKPSYRPHNDKNNTLFTDRFANFAYRGHLNVSWVLRQEYHCYIKKLIELLLKNNITLLTDLVLLPLINMERLKVTSKLRLKSH